jgi:ATP-binding cassette subfamily F protein 3
VSLVVIENGSLGFGGRTLFSELALRIGEEDRVGVVGRNGSGKSSLLKIIASRQEPSTGTLRYARGARVGYLPQEIEAPASGTVIDVVLASVPGRERIEQMLEDVEEQLTAGGDDETVLALAQKMADLHEELGRFESMFSRHEALRILAGLGFKDVDLSRGIERLSGGWRMRAALASLLFQRPDLLLLDEPTNHLDVPSVAWLADFMRAHHGALMLICHDREFLNEQVEKIVSFEPEGVRQYKGNYEQYRVARAEEIEVLDRRAVNLAREREQAERFIRRFRAQASKARSVQSRIKALAKLDDVASPNDQASLDFRFPPSKRAGQDVIRLEDVAQDYGQGSVFARVSTLVRRGERVALVGANGNGKSTLLRIMAGALVPTSGRCVHGHNVEIGYYAQHVAERLDLERSVFDEVWSSSVVHELARVRSALGTMMFSGDDVNKKIGVLSGGEKARVAIARLLVRPGNVILMDEPTNHLDLESAEALAEALASFDGTLIFASHNRSFVNRLATRILDVAGGVVEDYPGTLAAYMDRCAKLADAGETETKESVTGVTRNVAPTSTRPTVKPAPAAPARTREEEKKARARKREAGRRVGEYEARIAEIEAAQTERSSLLSKPETYADATLYERLLGEYRRDASKLEELLGRWEAAQSDLGSVDETSE